MALFKNKAPDGKNNICGQNVARLRMSMDGKVSQNALAKRLQLENIDLDKNAIQKIESGQRYVTDIELAGLAKTFGVSVEELLKPNND